MLAAAAGLVLAATSAVKWYKYEGVDCGKIDIKPQPLCSATTTQGNISGLESCCVGTAGCTGFNSHNVIKGAGCASAVSPANCDLYLRSPLPPSPKPYPAPPSQRQTVGLWPRPHTVSSGDTTVALSQAFHISVVGGSTRSLDAAVARYTRLILLHGRPSRPGGDPLLDVCSVTVSSSIETLGGIDESYQLNLTLPDQGRAAMCTIAAKTFVGAIYGLESFSQLVLSGAGAGAGSAAVSYTVPGAPWQISDTPRFVFRGLMVDTARHWLPINALRRQIDAMSFSKMNTLHWHLTDAQSTPYDSTAFPLLKRGAFAPRLVYTADDIAEIVEYARLRGVEVLLEIDMPGHNYAFGVGYPELIVNCTAMCQSPPRLRLAPDFHSTIAHATPSHARLPGCPHYTSRARCDKASALVLHRSARNRVLVFVFRLIPRRSRLRFHREAPYRAHCGAAEQALSHRGR